MKLLVICNNAPLYRKAIFTLIDKTFDCDWVFGESLDGIKQFDVEQLSGDVSIVRNKSLFNKKVYWQKGVPKLAFKNYTHIITIGEERCLSTWLLCLLTKMMPKKKIYFWTHGPYGKEGLLKRMVQYVFYRLVDGAFVYNNYSRNILINRGLNKDTFVTIHNSLDYDRQIELRNSDLSSTIYREHFGNNNPVLLFIGRLTKVKKLDLFVDAVSLLKEKGKAFNIVFVGDGIEGDFLRKLVKERGLEEQVWFYGACYVEKTNAILIHNADLCVAPGNVGLTAMHTMVFGTPVISHNNFSWQMPEFEAIHPGETGDFFEMDNVESLANTINQWFDNGKSREEVRNACYHEIDTQWNPYYQIEVLKKNLA